MGNVALRLRQSVRGRVQFQPEVNSQDNQPAYKKGYADG
jgi:hypothetical protein